jgi:hypothetical protein
MNDPKLPPLPSDIEQLVRTASAPLPPLPEGLHRSVLLRVNGTLSLGAAGLTGALGPYGAWLSGATLLVGLGGGILVAPLVRPPPEPAVPVVALPPVASEKAVTATVPTDLEAPVPTVEPAPSKVVPPPRTVKPAPETRPSEIEEPAPTIAPPPMHSRDTDLADERALLEMARSALARGDPKAALVAIDSHAKRFSTGQLLEERESLAIPALVAIGRQVEARARAAEFRARFPQSMLLPAVESALEPEGP